MDHIATRFESMGELLSDGAEEHKAMLLREVCCLMATE